MNVKDKIAVITGGASGIGKSVVEKLHSQGAKVVVLDTNKVALETLSQELSGIGTYVCDVTNYDAVTTTIDSIFDELNCIDILVNNVGILRSHPLVSFSMKGIAKHDPTEWDTVITTNLNSVFYVGSCVAEKMLRKRTKGVIVNISSVSAAGNPGQSAYSAAKAGVNALTKTWSKELGPMGIRVVSVAPGFIDIHSTHSALSESVLEDTRKKIPLKRLGTLNEIASGIISVIENDFISGTVIEIDGGIVI